MGNNASQLNVQHSRQKSFRRRSHALNNDLKPSLDHREYIPPIDSKAKPTAASVTTTSNLFLDNIIDHASTTTTTTQDYAEGEVIEIEDNGDYFNYKQPNTNIQEIDNELSLPANENDDTLFDDDDDAIYTPGLENQEYLRDSITIKYTDSSLNLSDTVSIIGNFTHTNTQISDKRSNSSSALFPNKIELVPFLSESKVQYFHVDINLPIGIYKCKFLINNKRTSISNDMPIATDKSGNVVNWFEVRPNTNQLYDYYNNSNPSKVGVANLLRNNSTSVSNNNLSRPNNILQNIRANNSTLSSFNLTLTKEKLQYSKEIPEIYLPFIPDLGTDKTEFLPEIDPHLLEKYPIPELPIYLNNSYLNKQFNQQHNSGNHTPNGGHHPQGNSIMKGLNFHIIPHVNLNHLLTSNIKNNVLTVACTTRYHGKFVTQIMYSPSELP